MELEETRRARLWRSVAGPEGKGSIEDWGLSAGGGAAEAGTYTVICGAVTVARTRQPASVSADAGAVSIAAVATTGVPCKVTRARTALNG